MLGSALSPEPPHHAPDLSPGVRLVWRPPPVPGRSIPAMALRLVHVHQAVLGYQPHDVAEVDTDDPKVVPYLPPPEGGGQLSYVATDEVAEAVAQVVTNPPGLIPDLDLTTLPNRGEVEAFAAEFGVDVTGLKTRGDVEAAVDAERTRRAEAVHDSAGDTSTTSIQE
jgi:hypothetical protein